MKCVEALNAALHEILQTRPETCLLGEDLLDPYGGAFKVSRGLSTRFPDQVLTTPISEGAIVGVAAGMALRGMLPIVEIMFGDFVALCFDQLLNHGAKFAAMYDGKAACHFVLRTPMGGYRGYGPTHSQTLEKFLVGIPHLSVVAPSHLHDLGALLKRVVLNETGPVVFIENKTMYAAECRPGEERVGPFQVCAGGSAAYPTLRLSLTGFEYADVTVVTYGGMLSVAMEAAVETLVESEVAAEIVVPCRLSPLDVEPIMESVHRSGKLVTVEEGTLTGGVGAEIVARVCQRGQPAAATRVHRVAALDEVIPSARPLESRMLPSKESIKSAILAMNRQGPAPT